MSSHRRVAVCRTSLERPLYHVKFKVAKELVQRGRAEFIGDDDRAIRLIQIDPVAASSIVINGNRQGGVYERAAIERNRQYVPGGLMRNEHKPAPFMSCSGAKVGHQ